MTVHGCPGCGRMLTFQSHLPEDDLSDVRAHGFAGCPTCNVHFCSSCAADLKLVCPNDCGTPLVLNEFQDKPRGDYRLHPRLAAVSGHENRLAELEKMKVEWKAKWKAKLDAGKVSWANYHALEYYEQVLHEDPRHKEWIMLGTHPVVTENDPRWDDWHKYDDE